MEFFTLLLVLLPLVTLPLQLSCFCNSAPDSIDHLFFECPLAQSVLSWLQSLMFRWSLLAPSLAVRHVRFGLIFSVASP